MENGQEGGVFQWANISGAMSDISAYIWNNGSINDNKKGSEELKENTPGFLKEDKEENDWKNIDIESND